MGFVLKLLQGVDCSGAGRVVNVTVAVNVPQRGGILTIDPKIKHPGASQCNLTSLQNLFLANVNFSVPIPPDLRHLHNLITQVFGDAFTGELPSTLGKLTKLQHFDIRGGSSTNEMTASSCNMVELVTLNGSADPSCLSKSQKNLQQLAVGNNLLTGPLPVWVTYFPALLYLDLHGNSITGTTPPEFLAT